MLKILIIAVIQGVSYHQKFYYSLLMSLSFDSAKVCGPVMLGFVRTDTLEGVSSIFQSPLYC